MPTYQYACTECSHTFEQFQSFSEDALSECPACQGRLRKLYNAVGVVFKGSGFYRTDSRAAGTSSEKAPGSTTTDAASSGSDSSPGTKADSTSPKESKPAAAASSAAPAATG